MHSIQWYILSIALLNFIACCLPGTFLLLRGVALMSDAISHAILPGVVIMFLMIGNLDSPLLIIGAALTGLLTVVVTELLIQTNRMGKDTAIGLVFPFFFSVGVLLIKQYARNTHLDLDMVLLGEIAFAPCNHFYWAGYDWGPQALITMALMATINGILLILVYKEMVLVTFDTTLGRILGRAPTALYYGLMAITSITAVTAFNSVGSTVVVALMLVPAATAYLLTNRMVPLLSLGLIIGCTAVMMGYTFASLYDLSIAGSIASTTGLLFIIAWLCSPHKGICAHLLFERNFKRELATKIVCTLLEKNPAHAETIAHKLGWSQKHTEKILRQGLMAGKIKCRGQIYSPSE